MERILIRFQRGNDRRVAAIPVARERRVSQRDRRRPDLGWSPLFNGVDPDEILEAVNEQEILLMEPGEILLQPGDPNDSIYLVLAGKLGVYIGKSGDADTAIPVQSGECLGELSAIDNRPISALVKVMEQARVLRLAQDVFWNRLMAVPGVAKNLLGVLAQRMRRNTESMLAAQRRQMELDHLGKELEVARQLQMGMLPMQRPLFPDRGEIDVAGDMLPSGSVGGDLFDAFFIDDNRMFFCVGDVSGHGISAAMFMARIVGLLRIAAFNVDTPAELLTLVNDQLCTGNDANLFVTLFCGIMDTATGRIEFSNAGHLPPLISNQGRIDALPLPKGAVMGVIPGYSYQNAACQLHEGDFMLCYTDGITEAHSATGEEFAEARLHELVQGLAAAPLEQVLDCVRGAVQAFTGDTYFEDDVTLLALRRVGQASS